MKTLSYTKISIQKRMRLRGAAMTELIICMFPYAIIALGSIVIGNVLMGRQECAKAVSWAAPKDGTQTLSDVQNFFFKYSVDSTQEYTEDDSFSPDEGLDYEASEDEPILPYDLTDMEKGITAGAMTLHYDVQTNEVYLRSTRIGRRLRNLGIIEDDFTELMKQRWSPEDVPQDLSFGIDPDVGNDLADILNSWLSFSRINVSMSIDMNDSLGDAKPIGENDGEAGVAKDFDIGKDSDERSLEKFAAYGVALNESARHNEHLNDSSNISFEKMLDFSGIGTQVDVEGIESDSSAYVLPDDSVFWDISYTEEALFESSQ